MHTRTRVLPALCRSGARIWRRCPPTHTHLPLARPFASHALFWRAPSSPSSSDSWESLGSATLPPALAHSPQQQQPCAARSALEPLIRCVHAMVLAAASAQHAGRRQQRTNAAAAAHTCVGSSGAATAAVAFVAGELPHAVLLHHAGLLKSLGTHACRACTQPADGATFCTKHARRAADYFQTSDPDALRAWQCFLQSERLVLHVQHPCMLVRDDCGRSRTRDASPAASAQTHAAASVSATVPGTCQCSARSTSRVRVRPAPALQAAACGVSTRMHATAACTRARTQAASRCPTASRAARCGRPTPRTTQRPAQPWPAAPTAVRTRR